MGHLTRVKDEYRDLVRRLNRGATAYLEPRTAEAAKGWKDILELLYTREEAELAARLPLTPEPLATLAQRLGMEPRSLEGRLDTMCDKGIAIDVVKPSTGERLYLLAPPSIGFLEFTLMRTSASKEVVAAIRDYVFGNDETFAREHFHGKTPLSRALLHEDRIGDELPDVLPWERASALVDQARSIAVSMCSCRHVAEHDGKACDTPLEMCMTLNEGAEYVIHRGLGRAIDKVEALGILTRARELGLVHSADNVQGRPIFICNCCSCCCGQLRAASEWGLAGMNPSGFEATLASEERCNGCSRCARACPVGAVTMQPRRQDATRRGTLVPQIDAARCIGCGVCTRACKPDALQMTRRREQPYVPMNAVEKAIRSAVEHGRLADLIVDQGPGLGARFMHAAVAAILALPPVKQALASEQLGSRFLRALASRVPDPLAQ